MGCSGAATCELKVAMHKAQHGGYKVPDLLAVEQQFGVAIVIQN